MTAACSSKENRSALGETLPAEASPAGKKIPRVGDIPEVERTALVVSLLEIIHLLQEENQSLKDEIARLKGQKPRPTIKPSNLERRSPNREGQNVEERRPGSSKRGKTAELEIHRSVIIQPENLSEGSRFKDYQDWTVQDIVLRTYNTLYCLERWELPGGGFAVGKLPDEVAGRHFGVTLRCHILYQHYQMHVTQPLILEGLRELGVDISSGQVNRIITEGNGRLHAEKDEILRVGLTISGHIHVDDTGARHKGQNGYCTHIGNELFAWFQSTESKSRTNFLELLRVGSTRYVINDYALDYMRGQKLPKVQMEQLLGCGKRMFEDEATWRAALESLQFNAQRHIRIATEGAMLGGIVEEGLIHPELVIVSDDAGQFAILLHALCWIHAERTIQKLVGFNDAQQEAVEQIRSRIWDDYGELKAYKQAPCEEKKRELETRFDEIFSTRTCYQSLNQALKRIAQNKGELLLVLDRPEIPLHNNTSERDIREYVKKRKISGSTRSDLGRRCRDTFTSLKKTCRKLKVSFWEYLKDRVSGTHTIEPLADLMRWQARHPCG
jgi:hypothetical protein